MKRSPDWFVKFLPTLNFTEPQNSDHVVLLLTASWLHKQRQCLDPRNFGPSAHQRGPCTGNSPVDSGHLEHAVKGLTGNQSLSTEAPHIPHYSLQSEPL